MSALARGLFSLISVMEGSSLETWKGCLFVALDDDQSISLAVPLPTIKAREEGRWASGGV